MGSFKLPYPIVCEAMHESLRESHSKYDTEVFAALVCGPGWVGPHVCLRRAAWQDRNPQPPRAMSELQASENAARAVRGQVPTPEYLPP